MPVPAGPPLPARALPPLPPTPQSPLCSGAGSAARCGTSARLVPPPATGQVPAGPERSPGRAAPRGGAGPGRRARCGGTGAGPARLGTERNGGAGPPGAGAGERGRGGVEPRGAWGHRVGNGSGPGARTGSQTREPDPNAPAGRLAGELGAALAKFGARERRETGPGLAGRCVGTGPGVRRPGRSRRGGAGGPAGPGAGKPVGAAGTRSCRGAGGPGPHPGPEGARGPGPGRCSCPSPGSPCWGFPVGFHPQQWGCSFLAASSSLYPPCAPRAAGLGTGTPMPCHAVPCCACLRASIWQCWARDLRWVSAQNQRREVGQEK